MTDCRHCGAPGRHVALRVGWSDGRVVIDHACTNVRCDAPDWFEEVRDLPSVLARFGWQPIAKQEGARRE